MGRVLGQNGSRQNGIQTKWYRGRLSRTSAETGGGGFGQMRTGGRGVKDLADVRKLVLFFIVSACFAYTLSVDDAY